MAGLSGGPGSLATAANGGRNLLYSLASAGARAAKTPCPEGARLRSIPDVHCHLESLPDADDAVAEAVAAGVGPIVAVGMRAAGSRRGLELRARHPGQVLAGVGLHPSEIPALDDVQLHVELEFVRDNLPDADLLGEVGLDFKDAADDLQRDRQRRAFEQQLAWAAAARKPANVHCRRAEREIVERCVAFARDTGLGVVLHWFTHSAKLARACGAAGLYISPGPSILHDPEQARVAAMIDARFLLLETDSPVVYAGTAARPAWAARVAEHLAAIRGVPPEALADQLRDNLTRYLGA
jgi:TatD DNase family protein